MKITIIGSGFAGLACAHTFAKAGYHVTVISSSKDQGASSIAAGLLHRFVGELARPNWKGVEALEASEQLIASAEEALEKSVIIHHGLLRLALSDDQQKNYYACARNNPENEWKTEHNITGVVPAQGVWIPRAYSIDSSSYLKGLKIACQKLGVSFIEEQLKTLPHPPVIIAAGSAVQQFAPEVKVRLVKGQLLRLAWPEGLPPLPCALSTKGYLVMDRDGRSCWAGSTYEKQFASADPDITLAKELILPKAKRLVPGLASAEILDCQAALRVSAPGHLPLIKEVKPGIWVVTGLGSKGLLYHSWAARELLRHQHM